MAEIKEKCSLVGKLVDVSIGDLVLLEDLKTWPTNVSGFVIKLTPETITLSHESPFNAKRDSHRVYDDPISYIFNSKGDQTYALDSFSRYDLLRKHDPAVYKESYRAESDDEEENNKQ